MPSKVVAVPDVGNVEFPDTMSDDEISNVIASQHSMLSQSVPGMERLGGTPPSASKPLNFLDPDKATPTQSAYQPSSGWFSRHPATGDMFKSSAVPNPEAMAVGPVGEGLGVSVANRIGKIVYGSVRKPGFPQIAGGAAEAGAGLGAIATGGPVGIVYGASGVAKGIGRIARGIAKNKAALEAPPTPIVPPPPVRWNPPAPVADASEIVPPPPVKWNKPASAPAPQPTAPIPAVKYWPKESQDVSTGRIPGRTPSMPPPEAAPAPATAPTKNLTLPANKTPKVSAKEATSRTALADDYAKVLHAEGNGINSADIPFMDDSHWQQVAEGVDQLRGVPKGAQRTGIPSPETKAQIVQKMQRLEQGRDAAVKLRDAMQP